MPSHFFHHSITDRPHWSSSSTVFWYQVASFVMQISVYVWKSHISFLLLNLNLFSADYQLLPSLHQKLIHAEIMDMHSASFKKWKRESRVRWGSSEIWRSQCKSATTPIKSYTTSPVLSLCAALIKCRLRSITTPGPAVDPNVYKNTEMSCMSTGIRPTNLSVNFTVWPAFLLFVLKLFKHLCCWLAVTLSCVYLLVIVCKPSLCHHSRYCIKICAFLYNICCDWLWRCSGCQNLVMIEKYTNTGFDALSDITVRLYLL